MKPLLSVLMASMPHRPMPYLDKVCTMLPDWAELIINNDEHMSIGSKRQLMIERSRGEYVMMLDDDDCPANDFFNQLKPKLMQGVDAVGILTLHIKNGEYRCFQKWGYRHTADTEQKTFLGHLCPVKRELVIECGYRDYGEGEDFDHMIRLQPLIKSALYTVAAIIIFENTLVEKEYHRHHRAPVHAMSVADPL
jgi:hypothetical protein